MTRGRIEAFSDGVIAILITIMVLELKAPRALTFSALRPVLPTFLCYLFSYVIVGIYWVNHHHLFQTIHRVNGAVLWANLHLLFWLSLIPFTTAWMGGGLLSSASVALYGFVLLMAGVAYFILTFTLLRLHGRHSTLGAAIGKDFKGKISVVIYAVAVPLAFVNRWISLVLYIAVALIWLVPDLRIERTLSHEAQ